MVRGFDLCPTLFILHPLGKVGQQRTHGRSAGTSHGCQPIPNRAVHLDGSNAHTRQDTKLGYQVQTRYVAGGETDCAIAASGRCGEPWTGTWIPFMTSAQSHAQRAVSISPSALDELGPGQFDRLITQALEIQPWVGRQPADPPQIDRE